MVRYSVLILYLAKMKLSLGVLFAISQALLVASSPASSPAADVNPLEKRDGTCSFLTERWGYNKKNKRCWHACDSGAGSWCWSYHSDPLRDNFAQATTNTGEPDGGCARYTDCFPVDQQEKNDMLKCACG
jgi:hypothetical protein